MSKSYLFTYRVGGSERHIPVRRCYDIDDAYKKLSHYVRWHHNCEPEIIGVEDITQKDPLKGGLDDYTINRWQ